MAVYMKFGDIKGSVTTDKFKDWIELDSFSFSTNRNVGTAARGASHRESTEPTIGEIHITKKVDTATPKLFMDAVAGHLDSKVTIKMTTTTKNGVTDFLTYELTETGVSSYSIQSHGDHPSESMTLNFTKVSKTFKPLDPKISGTPETVGYDLKQMKTV